MTEQSTPFIDGIHFYLRPIARADYDQSMDVWLNDREVTRFLSRGTFPQSAEQRQRTYDAMINSTTDVEFAIVRKDTHQAIGVAGLHGIQWVARHAEFRILIGDKKSWGNNIGTEVCQLLTAYAFEVLNLQKVWLGVNAENKAAYRSYGKAGFAEEGRLRNEVFRNGRYYDVVRMSILQDEYQRALPNWRCQALIATRLQHHG